MMPGSFTAETSNFAKVDGAGVDIVASFPRWAGEGPTDWAYDRRQAVSQSDWLTLLRGVRVLAHAGVPLSVGIRCQDWQACQVGASSSCRTELPRNRRDSLPGGVGEGGKPESHFRPPLLARSTFAGPGIS